MMNEEYVVHVEENELNDEEMTDEIVADEDDMTDEELTLITKIQIALVGVLFGMAIMGLLVYATTPAFKFFI